MRWNKRGWAAHRLVAQHFLGPCPEGLEVIHMCERGQNGCVTGTHLKYGTHQENMVRRFNHGGPWGFLYPRLKQEGTPV